MISNVYKLALSCSCSCSCSCSVGIPDSITSTPPILHDISTGTGDVAISSTQDWQSCTWTYRHALLSTRGPGFSQTNLHLHSHDASSNHRTCPRCTANSMICWYPTPNSSFPGWELCSLQLVEWKSDVLGPNHKIGRHKPFVPIRCFTDSPNFVDPAAP